MNQDKIGKFIAKLRKEKNMTQQELAKKLNVTDKAISKWENGRCLMDIALLKPLSEIFDVTIVEIINGEKLKEKETSNRSDEVIYKTLNYTTSKIKRSRIKTIIMTVISVLLIISLVFITYKGILLSIYNIPQDEVEKLGAGLRVKKTLTIYKRTILENEYLKIDDIKIRNDFKDYEEVERSNEHMPYIFKGKDKNGNSVGVSFTSTSTYIDNFASDDVVIFSGEESKIIDFGQFNSVDKKYFLLKKDINNDINLLKYIGENGYHKSNIFMSDRQIKENYAINLFTSVAIPEVESISLINGDYSGYIFNFSNKSIKPVVILRNGKAYSFLFSGDKYTDEYLVDLLGTLEIK